MGQTKTTHSQQHTPSQVVHCGHTISLELFAQRPTNPRKLADGHASHVRHHLRRGDAKLPIRLSLFRGQTRHKLVGADACACCTTCAATKRNSIREPGRGWVHGVGSFALEPVWASISARRRVTTATGSENTVKSRNASSQLTASTCKVTCAQQLSQKTHNREHSATNNNTKH